MMHVFLRLKGSASMKTLIRSLSSSPILKGGAHLPFSAGSSRASQALHSYSFVPSLKTLLSNSLFLESRRFLESSLSGSSRAALHSFSSFANLKSFVPSLKAISSWKPKLPNSPRGLDYCLVILVAGVYTFCDDMVPVSGRSHVILIPKVMENLLGIFKVSVLDIDSLPLDTPPTMRVAQILDNLCNAESFQARTGKIPTLVVSGKEGFKLTVFGETMILCGLEDGLDDAALAAAFSHQLGHMMARHSAESVSRHIMVDGVCFFLMLRGYLSGVLSFIAHLGCSFLVSSARHAMDDYFDFRNESEANLIARKLMSEALYEFGRGDGSSRCTFKDGGFWARFWLQKLFISLKKNSEEYNSLLEMEEDAESAEDDRASAAGEDDGASAAGEDDGASAAGEDDGASAAGEDDEASAAGEDDGTSAAGEDDGASASEDGGAAVKA